MIIPIYAKVSFMQRSPIKCAQSNAFYQVNILLKNHYL
ncbi:hypothetical protein BCLUESOX_353 [bacterium endosymbiont of Bathymodiolus sp. 5 South]|nr:hypothetical protein BCLUESOX_353 [bacterium endosymbiont of Bathymodiolus sp. 5 South]